MNSNFPSTPISTTGAGFSRRRLLAAAFAAPALAAVLAACGDDTKGPATQPTTSTPPVDSTGGSTPDSTGGSTPGTTAGSVAQGAVAHPTGAGDVVLRVGYEGGFVPRNVAFTSVPALLVSGDGFVYTPGATTAIYPGPMLPALFRRTITEDGIQRVLELASAAHLLQTPPDYEAEVNVTDVGNTVVTLSAGGETYVHSAYALGFDDPAASIARKALDTFVQLVGDIDEVAGADNLGENEPYVATRYRFLADVVTADSLTGLDIPPTLVEWPAAAGVKLADAASCSFVDADAIGTLFVDANQLTYFTEAGVTYQVSAVAELPGDVCAS